MGSFAGAAPTPMLAVYSASKSFLRTWSEGLAAELAPKGVIVEHVNTYYVVRLILPLPLRIMIIIIIY
jgi:17beta-estradiol 17-dehydrogenase / very-long-chain 3-oxoacyl-CoA reductase